MAKGGFTVQNADALTAQIRALSSAASESTLRQAAVAGARVYLEEMKLRVPVGAEPRHQGKETFPPGFGRDNLIIAYDAEKSVPGAIASYIVTWTAAAYYLRFVEFGTSRMSAKPFLRPSFEAKKTAAAQAVSDVINTKLKGASHVK